MLKKVYRITKDKEFQTIYRRGRFQSTALFSLHYLPSRNGVSRIGIVVSKKISKKAVERNKIKRQVRAIASEIHKSLNNNFDIVIAVKKPALEANFEEMQKTLKHMAERAKIID